MYLYVGGGKDKTFKVVNPFLSGWIKLVLGDCDAYNENECL